MNELNKEQQIDILLLSVLVLSVIALLWLGMNGLLVEVWIVNTLVDKFYANS